jgi:hypothetical protein
MIYETTGYEGMERIGWKGGRLGCAFSRSTSGIDTSFNYLGLSLIVNETDEFTKTF